MKAVG